MIERILALMRINNVNAAQLTSKLEISKSSITEWKKGKGKPTSESIIKLATYFDVSTDYLLGLTDEKKARPPADERTVVNSKIMEIYEALPADKQQLAEDYLEYLLSRQEKPKDN